MVGENLLAEGLVVQKSIKPRGLPAGIRLLHQLQVTDDVLVVNRYAVEFFEQVEGDIGPGLLDPATDHFSGPLGPQADLMP